MNTFHLIVSSPDGSKFDGMAENLSLRGTEGDLAIMASHIPFITAVKEGRCTIITEDGSEMSAQTSGGLLTVSKETVTFLTGKFVKE